MWTLLFLMPSIKLSIDPQHLKIGQEPLSRRRPNLSLWFNGQYEMMRRSTDRQYEVDYSNKNNKGNGAE